MLEKILVCGGIGCVYKKFVQQAVTRGFQVTSLLQNPTFLADINQPPHIAFPNKRDFVNGLTVDHPENLEFHVIGKSAVYMFVEFDKSIIDPNVYFDLLETVVPKMVQHKVPFLNVIASEGEMVDTTLKSMEEYLLDSRCPAKTGDGSKISARLIKYNRGEDYADKFMMGVKPFEGSLLVGDGINYKSNTFRFLNPFFITKYIEDQTFDEILSFDKNSKINFNMPIKSFTSISKDTN